MMKNKKVYIRTFGCQMNKRDSQVLAGALKRRGAVDFQLGASVGFGSRF